MFELTIKAKDFSELRSNVLNLYQSLGGEDHSHKLEPQMKFTDHLPLDPIPVIGQYESPAFVPPPELTKTLPDIPPMPVAQAPVTSSEVQEVDARGMPWNEKIHSTTKGLNKDGTWRVRRGVDKDQIAAVESDTVVQTVLKNPSPEQPFVPPVPSAPAYVPPQVVVAPTTQIAPALPQYDDFAGARKQAHDFKSFKESLIPSLAKLVKDGRLTVEYINSLKTYFKVTEIWQVNDEQCMEMFNQFAAADLINKVGA